MECTGEGWKNTDPANPDSDGDGLLDGQEVLGWYAYVELEEGEIAEVFVTSDPWSAHSDGDTLNDTVEFALGTNPREVDTDRDGVPDNLDDDPVLKEDVPPAMGDLTYTYTLEWAGPIVVHTWLHLSVAANDNVRVANVTFTFVSDGRAVVDTRASGGVYQATFEIDFWAHYMNAWEASAQGFDTAGNVMARVAQGGAVSTLMDFAAAFLAFWTGPITAGYVLGFFVGLGSTLFEDLSMLLHLQELWEALKQIPGLIGQLIADPGLLLEMVRGMVQAILDKAAGINPYPGATLNATGLLDAMADFFWAFVDPAKAFPALEGDADAFNLAFFLGHTTGMVAWEFLSGAAMGAVLGAFSKGEKALDAAKDLTKGLETAEDVLERTVKVTTRVSSAVGKGASSGLARRVAGLVDGLPFGWSDEIAEGMSRSAARWGPDARKLLTDVGDADELLVVMGRLGGKNADEIGTLMKTSVRHPWENAQKGARYHLDRIKAHGDDIADIEHRFPDGKRADLLLKDGRVVELKDWSPDTFHSKLRYVGSQVDAYNGHTGKQVILELKHKVNPDDIARLTGPRPWLKVVNGTG